MKKTNERYDLHGPNTEVLIKKNKKETICITLHRNNHHHQKKKDERDDQHGKIYHPDHEKDFTEEEEKETICMIKFITQTMKETSVKKKKKKETICMIKFTTLTMRETICEEEEE